MSYSPQELLLRNDFVMLADFVSADTLVSLGTTIHLGSESRFAAMEYVFIPQHIFKGDVEKKQIYLWSCDRIDVVEGSSTILDLDRLQSFLVYGKQLHDQEDLIDLMGSRSSVKDLRRILQDEHPERIVWNAREADSTITMRILKNHELREKLKKRAQKGPVIAPTDTYISTLKEYRYGVLCFENEKGKHVTVDRAEYLRELERLTRN